MAKPVDCVFIRNQSYCDCKERNEATPFNNNNGGVKPCLIYYGSRCDWMKNIPKEKK